MKRVFLTAAIASGLALTGCATTQTGQVDYAALVANACTVAVPEVAALQTLAPKLSDADQKALVTVAAVINPICAAPPTDVNSAWVTLAAVLPALTVLYVNNHTGAAQ